jgi:DNA-binding transcriptional LysR family regulator
VRYRDLDIDVLRCFATVAGQGGFTAAGLALGLTQSAVSLKIKRLEDLVQARLFDRTSRSLSLTADGELLLTYAYRLLSLNDEAVRQMVASSTSGPLRMGVADHCAPLHLAAILRCFTQAYPDMRFEVEIGRSHDLRMACDRGTLDLAIAKRREGEAAGTLVWTEPMAWVASESWVPGERLPLALLPPGCLFRDRALATLNRAELPHEIIYTSASLLGVLAATEGGMAVTVLGRSGLPPGLRELPDLPPLGNAEIAVFAGRKSSFAQIEALVGLIRDSLEATPAPRCAA